MVGRFVRISFVFAIVSLLTGCSSGPLDPESEASLAPRALELSVDCDTAEDLSARIAELEADGTLNPGRATALRSKLAQAERWDVEGRPDKAAAALQRLIDQLEDWVADGTLSEEDVEDLLLCAEDVADGPNPDFAVVSAGVNHTCGVTTTGDAYCWGLNIRGQLGDGTNTDSNTPVAVASRLSFATISAGTRHTCGVTIAGNAYCWGWNFAGQLGDGTNADSNIPAAVAGGLSFGDIRAGERHSCGVTAAGDAYCWGWNLHGQLGDGTNTDRNTPVAAEAAGLSFADISAGLHSCGVTTAGNAYCWGLNEWGQLGDGTNTDRNAPVPVNAGGLSFGGISAGGGHSCGVTIAGDAYCWGLNNWGQLADGTNTDGDIPVPVDAGGLSFGDISAGVNHTCGVTTDEDAYCWGENFGGQLGDGTNADRNTPVAVDAGGLSLADISAGLFHTCGVTTAGDAYCWGSNSWGQLGDATNTDSNVPVMVQEP